jgi:DNA helicase-2/ATP-dependent DNA helicase PcrA
MMNFLADFHIHSPYSRATSPSGDLAGLLAWARVKGINLIGTGDFTHPAWFRQLKELLAPAEPGLFRLKDEALPPALPGIKPEAITVRFILTAEISCIYKRHGRVRKVHNLLVVPDFASAERINAKLAAIGNIESDGRPILGLDSRDLLEILLENSEDGFLVPAHIWTPWFSLFGSKSGFDSVEECFGDLSHHIFALETGLSSDPDMNRRVSALDRYTLISNSDCHSPSKLGREVNLFSTDFDFFALRRALKDPSRGGFQGTVEFFPEEGKYHSDGHRLCHVCLDPLATRAIDSICPVCKRPLTIGVNHRVLELADRATPLFPAGQPGFTSLVPLPEVLGEIVGQGPGTKRVLDLYVSLINRFGSEFTILRQTPLEELRHWSPVMGEAIARIRSNRVIRHAGYDGEFGHIQLFQAGEIDELTGQESLFARAKRKVAARPAAVVQPFIKLKARTEIAGPEPVPNPEQQTAVGSVAPLILVTAGPGTGKTHTLVERIRSLIRDRRVPATNITAITFTNRAASEIEERLARQGISGLFVGTFHRFCLDWLRLDQPELTVAGAEDRELVLRQLHPALSKSERKQLSATIDHYLFNLNTGREPAGPSPEITPYLAALASQGMIDLDGVIPLLLQRLRERPGLMDTLRQQVRYLLVDEFQDVNWAQYELVRLLAATAQVFAIGDPDQAIYGFRGSDPAFFFDFAESRDLPCQTQVIALTRNYRSSATILTTAQALISHNPGRGGERSLVPEVKIPGRIEYYQAPTAKAEAEFVVQRLEETLGGVCHFSINTGRGGSQEAEISFADIAILYRLNSQAEELLTAINRRGIPAQVTGSVPFFMSHGLSAAYYWLQAAAGLATVAEHLLLCQGVGLPPAALTTLEQLPAATPDFFQAVATLPLGAKGRNRIVELRQGLIDFGRALDERELPALLAETLKELGLGEVREGQRLLDLAGLFGRDLATFARHLRANANSTVYDSRAEAVSLMSLHAAKGLEFPVVFICGLEEGTLPHLPSGREADIEEERRLLYVGLTRAREQLILTSSLTRTSHGQSQAMAPSRFLQELPLSEITLTPGRPQKKKRPADKQLSLF